jgi:hypothetical protein
MGAECSSLSPSSRSWRGRRRLLQSSRVARRPGAQETLRKPAIALLIAPSRRTTAFGIFDTCFGTAWLVGSIAFGLLYDKSLPLLVTVSVVGQLLSLPLFFLGRTASQTARR